MERADETGNGQEQQYWQQPQQSHAPYESYGQQSYDYASYGEYAGQGHDASGYQSDYQSGHQTGYDPAAYQQQSYEQQSYEQQSYEQQYQQSYDYGQQGYTQQYPQQTGYEQQQQHAYYEGQYTDPQYAQPYQQQAYYAEPSADGAETTPYWATPEETLAADSAIPAQASAPDRESIPGDEAAESAAAPVGSTAVRRGRKPPADGLKNRVVDAALGRGPGVDRKSFRTRLLVGGGALAVLAVAGYLVMGGGSGGGRPTAGSGPAPADIGVNHSKAWAAPAAAGATTGNSSSGSGGGGNDGLLGAWVTTDAVVRGDGEGVTAYSATDGHKLWSVSAPSSGAVPCAMSPTVNSAGVGAVLFQAQPGNNQACNLLSAVDAGSGQTKWKAQLPSGGTNYGASVMASDTRVVAVTDSAAVGFDLAGGKQAWSYSGPGKYCALSGSGAGSSLLLQSTCADTSPKQQVLSLDPDSGKMHWWRGLPQSASSYTVLSANPAVVSVHMSDASQDSIMSFSDKGDSQGTIPVAQTGGALDSTHGSFDPDPAPFFSGTTMVAAVSPPPQSAKAASGPTVIAAYDLLTGKELWRTTAHENGVAAPVGIDGSAAVVATDERVGQPARLSNFDLTTGTETVGGTFPQGTGSLLGSGRVLLRGSLVVALPEYTGSYNTSATAWNGSH